jgi:hypothetical protein
MLRVKNQRFGLSDDHLMKFVLHEVIQQHAASRDHAAINRTHGRVRQARGRGAAAALSNPRSSPRTDERPPNR